MYFMCNGYVAITNMLNKSCEWQYYICGLMGRLPFFLDLVSMNVITEWDMRILLLNSFICKSLRMSIYLLLIYKDHFEHR